MAYKDIKTIRDFLKVMLTCDLNKGGTIIIPKSIANDIIEYINVVENYRKDKS